MESIDELTPANQDTASIERICRDDDSDNDGIDTPPEPYVLDAILVKVSFGRMQVENFYVSDQSRWAIILESAVSRMHLPRDQEWAICEKIPGWRSEPFMVEGFKVVDAVRSFKAVEQKIGREGVFLCRQVVVPREIDLDVTKLHSRLTYGQAAREYCITAISENPDMLVKCAAAMLQFDTPRFGRMPGKLKEPGNVEQLLPKRALKEQSRKFWVQRIQEAYDAMPKRSTNAAMNFTYKCFQELKLFGTRTYIVKPVEELPAESVSLSDDVYLECRRYWAEDLGVSIQKITDQAVRLSPDPKHTDFALAFDPAGIRFFHTAANDQGGRDPLCADFFSASPKAEAFIRFKSTDPSARAQKVLMWGFRKNVLQMIVLSMDDGLQKPVPMRLNLRVAEAAEINWLFNKFWRM